MLQWKWNFNNWRINWPAISRSKQFSCIEPVGHCHCWCSRCWIRRTVRVQFSLNHFCFSPLMSISINISIFNGTIMYGTAPQRETPMERTVLRRFANRSTEKQSFHAGTDYWINKNNFFPFRRMWTKSKLQFRIFVFNLQHFMKPSVMRFHCR